MLRIGLIGCGYIAKKHVKTLAQFDEMSLIAVSDIQRKKMENIIGDYQQQKKDIPISSYENYKYLLADPRVDAVIISTISSLHAEMTIEALKSNKHVIVEKPLALSLKDTNKIINLAKKRNRKVLVCHQLRYRPLIQKIYELIQKGYFGKLYFGAVTLMLNRSSEYYETADWKGTWTNDGGMLINQGIHLVDLLLWMFGDVNSVYGEISAKLNDKETEDIAVGMINFKSGSKGLINANTITTPENLGYYLSVFGEKGSIQIAGKGFDQLKHCYIEDHPKFEKELVSLAKKLDEHYFMYQNFYQSVVGKEKILMSAVEAKKSLQGIFSLYQSSMESKQIHAPIENFSTSDMNMTRLS